MSIKILVADTDRSTRRLLQRFLPKSDVRIRSVEHKGIIEAIEDECPDILLLEQADLCAHIRHHWPRLPIIVLLDNTQKQQIPQILDAGADDCVMKPFEPAELGARIRAHVRRAQSGTAILKSQDGYISMSVLRHQLCVSDQQVHLTTIEFDLLKQLMMHAERVLTRHVLLQRVWGENYSDAEDSLRVYIRQLRRKIEPIPSQPQYILTAPGIGYVFRTPTMRNNGLSAEQ